MARRKGRRIEYQLWLDNRLKAGLMDAQQQMYYFSRSVGGMSQRMSGTIGAVATGNAKLIAGAFVVGAASASWQMVKYAADFENKWAEVTTLVPDLSERMTDQLRDQMQGLSSDFAVSQKTMTQGYYDAISAGVNYNQMLQFQANSARLARGGLIQHDAAVKLLAQHMNAYGQDVAATQTISDIFFQGMKKGVLTIGQLAANMHQVTPIAAELNVELAETTAMVATITKLGAPTDIAATRIGALMVELMRTGQKADLFFRRASGNKGLREFIEDGNNLADVIYTMDSLRRQENMEWAEIFSRKEATLAAANLASTEGRRIQTENMAAMADSAGATEDAYNKMADTTQFELDRITQRWEQAKISVGESTAGMSEAILALAGVMEFAGQSVADFFYAAHLIATDPGAVAENLGKRLGNWVAPGEPFELRTEENLNAQQRDAELARLGRQRGSLSGLFSLQGQPLRYSEGAFAGGRWHDKIVDQAMDFAGDDRRVWMDELLSNMVSAWDVRVFKSLADQGKIEFTGYESQYAEVYAGHLSEADQLWRRTQHSTALYEEMARDTAVANAARLDDIAEAARQQYDLAEVALAGGVAPGRIRQPGEGSPIENEDELRDRYMLETLSPARWLAYLEGELAKVEGGLYDERERSLLYEIKAVKDAIDKQTKKMEDREYKLFLDIATEEGIVIKSDQIEYGIRKAVTGGRHLVSAERPLS